MKPDPNQQSFTATFRFYEELNFFLSAEQHKRDFEYSFKGHPAIKDTIEAIGVPHTEVEVILVNGRSVDFNYQLQHGDRVSVYPVFESLDITPLVKLRQEPLRKTAFICDVHLGKLATLLRLMGFDTLYRNDYDDKDIIDIALKEKRIILTCDRGILKNGRVTHGYCLQSRQGLEQAKEVLNRFDLANQARPFSRCTVCNSSIEPVDKETIVHQLPAKVANTYDDFYQCTGCDRIYWQGSHYTVIWKKLDMILQNKTL